MSEKMTVSKVKESKNTRKITMLTAYDYGMASILDQAGVDILLVGDSLGNVMLGYGSTLPVTMEEVIHHAKAVTRATKNALVVADMPFMSYQISVEQGMENAGRLLKETGAHAVKLEGGREIEPLVRKLVVAGIPVVGHLGLTPQSVNQLGGFKVQGKSIDDARKIIEDAKLLEQAGAFAIVLECIPAKLAQMITASIGIPTIGIGAGAYCDGQVLVCNDFLGLNTGFTPKFVKKYRNLCQEIATATKEYIEDVQSGSFPSEQHSFSISDDVMEKLY